MASGQRPTVNEINAMNKQDLMKLIKGLLDDLKSKDKDGQSLNHAETLNTILTEVKKHNQATEALQKQVEVITKEKDQLFQIVSQQQRFLEVLDAGKRACNLIIMGVPETPTNLTAGEESASSDDEKVKMILKTSGHNDAEIQEISRLGKVIAGRARPTKVVLKCPMKRKSILNDAKKLKDAGDEFKKIFIKKDVHPCIRKELYRLREAEKRESEKAENTGKEVKYDHANRTLSVNGTIIDRYMPIFFQ